MWPFGLVFSLMSAFSSIFSECIKGSWGLLEDSALFFLAGLLIAGVLKAFLPEAAIYSRFGSRTKASVLKAAFWGIPLPLCSCSVLPLALSFRKQGASKGAVSAFLISTPETGIDSFLVSFALLDPLLTVLRPVGAFISAIFTGIIQNWMDIGSGAEPKAPAGKT